MIQQRLDKLRKFLEECSLEAVVITKPENRRYFSGFTGSSGLLLITRQTQTLFTDFRYLEQAAEQAPNYQLVRHGADLFSLLAAALAKQTIACTGFESDFVTWDTYHKLSDCLPNSKLQPVKLDALRMIKDAAELALLQKAVEIADAAFNQILAIIRPGLTELEIALELEYHMRKLGSEKPAFDTIVASGYRGALPHGQAANKVIETGDLITMDFGAVYQGYHSDMTRTVVAGKATDKQREIYAIVQAAQLAGVTAIAAGKTGKEVDLVSRQLIAAAGYGDYFGHSLGHGVGLAIHEEPRLSPANDGKLSTDMVVSVEPGIYLPGWGGIRIEDLVVVSATGCTVLTASSKDLIELD